MPVTTLKRGSYFGEVGLLRGTHRSACVRAASAVCELFVLSKVSHCQPCEGQTMLLLLVSQSI